MSVGDGDGSKEQMGDGVASLSKKSKNTQMRSFRRFLYARSFQAFLPVLVAGGAVGALIGVADRSVVEELQTALLALAGALAGLTALSVLVPLTSRFLRGEGAPYELAEPGQDVLAFKLGGMSLRMRLGAERAKLRDRAIRQASYTASDWRRTYEQASLSRMSDNLRALGQRATWSLMAGLSFASAGVALLFVTTVTIERSAVADLWAFAREYAPRLSITVIVELVAFFFLRTYARTLTDIRYVQNEFTNVEMKLIALHASIDLKYEDIAKEALLSLVDTERNHVLEKGQTSLELERERLETEGFVAGAQAFAGVFNAQTKLGSTAK
jgi:hypothetical protein